MILTLTIGLIFSLTISGYLIYVCDAAPTIVTMLMMILLLGVPLLHDTEKILFAGVFYGTTCIVIILNVIRMDINELKEHEKFKKKQHKKNTILKMKIVDYFNQGYLIVDRYKGFKYTHKSLDELINLDFIEQICEVKGYHDVTEKYYVIKYNQRLVENLDKRYKMDRTIHVLKIKNGQKLY